MKTETATLDPDTWYACPRCGTRQLATGTELAMFCDGGRRHRPTAMRRVDTIDGTDTRTEAT